MNIDDFLKGLQIEIPEIRFCGVVEKSGHLHAGLYKQGIDEHLKGRNPEISFTQSAYIIDLRRMFSQELGKLESVLYVYEKVKMASIPLREEILVMSTDRYNLTRHISREGQEIYQSTRFRIRFITKCGIYSIG